MVSCNFVTHYASYEQYRWSLKYPVQLQMVNVTTLAFRPRPGPTTFRSNIYRHPTLNDRMKNTTESTRSAHATRSDMAMALGDSQDRKHRPNGDVGGNTRPLGLRCQNLLL